MSSALPGKTAPGKETRKILLRQIKKADVPLKGQQAGDSQVHRARKQIKMARATVRLLREALPRKRYRAANQSLRDAARPLSEARDATVLLTTFEDLLNGQGRRLKKSLQDFHDELTRERTRTRRQIANRRGLRPSRELLRSARTHAAQWHVGRKGWSIIGAGLGRTYAEGRDALHAVRKTPTDAAFHEWRKQAKYLRHQLQVLQPIRPGTLGTTEKQLHDLADYLGDDHDLSVLKVRLASRSAQLAADPTQRQLDARINRRRVALQRKALRLGARIYQETPAEFCHRIQGYWDAWRGGQP